MRKPRRLIDGARYHVTARVNHQEMRLDDSAMKTLFLDTVKRAKMKYDFTIENFTIMGNHYHLIIKPLDKSNLSRIMQWIMGLFARAYNRIHNLKGHFWQGRFFSRVIDSFKDLLDVHRYIDENPVMAGLAVHAWDWLFGGLAHHRANRADVVAKLDRCLELMLPSHHGRVIG